MVSLLHGPVALSKPKTHCLEWWAQTEHQGKLLPKPLGLQHPDFLFNSWRFSSSAVTKLGNPLSMQPSKLLLLETFPSIDFVTWDGVSLHALSQHKSLRTMETLLKLGLNWDLRDAYVLGWSFVVGWISAKSICTKLIPCRQGREGTETTSKSQDNLQHFFSMQYFPKSSSNPRGMRDFAAFLCWNTAMLLSLLLGKTCLSSLENVFKTQEKILLFVNWIWASFLWQ